MALTLKGNEHNVFSIYVTSFSVIKVGFRLLVFGDYLLYLPMIVRRIKNQNFLTLENLENLSCRMSYIPCLAEPILFVYFKPLSLSMFVGSMLCNAKFCFWLL